MNRLPRHHSLRQAQDGTAAHNDVNGEIAASLKKIRFMKAGTGDKEL